MTPVKAMFELCSCSLTTSWKLISSASGAVSMQGEAIHPGRLRLRGWRQPSNIELCRMPFPHEPFSVPSYRVYVVQTMVADSACVGSCRNFLFESRLVSHTARPTNEVGIAFGAMDRGPKYRQSNLRIFPLQSETCLTRSRKMISSCADHMQIA